MKFRLFALLSACVLLLPLVSCVRRDRLPDRPAFSAESGLGTETETDSGGAPVLRRSRGSARSAESRYLVLLLDWELKQTATDSKTAQPTVTVTVTVSLSHYSLQVGARNGGYVSLGGERRAFSTPPLSSGGSEQAVTQLAVCEFSLPTESLSGAPLPISASWDFGGVYHGQSLPTLCAAGSVTVE